MSKEVRIVANWKMNKTVDESVEFIQKLPITTCLVFIAPPFPALYSCAQNKPAMASIGAQNIHSEANGAFTGEVSAHMVKEAGGDFAIIGHSERRRIFKESNSFINQKVKQALLNDLIPILCIGETASEREDGKTLEVLKKQLLESLAEIPPENISEITLAYEPVWAIGTGQAATAQMTQETLFNLRKIVQNTWGEECAEEIFILYGGSITPENIEEFLQEPDIDGVLIGGASLDHNSFSKIIQISGNIVK